MGWTAEHPTLASNTLAAKCTDNGVAIACLHARYICANITLVRTGPGIRSAGVTFHINHSIAPLVRSLAFPLLVPLIQNLKKLRLNPPSQLVRWRGDLERVMGILRTKVRRSPFGPDPTADRVEYSSVRSQLFSFPFHRLRRKQLT